MARGGGEMVPGKKMKNEAVRNKMKKKEKGERKKKKRKRGRVIFLLIYGPLPGAYIVHFNHSPPTLRGIIFSPKLKTFFFLSPFSFPLFPSFSFYSPLPHFSFIVFGTITPLI